MKKFLTGLFFLTMLFLGLKESNAMTFEEGMTQTKPMALLIYADWADNVPEMKQAFEKVAPDYSSKFNFVDLNIASQDAKAFNKVYHIYPNIPYVLFFKDRGRVSRYVQKDCVLNDACLRERLDFFAR